jgi:crotonobetainyl-CoA:carnitine CoA-transferase CaiB-like acyl-CoA transferase
MNSPDNLIFKDLKVIELASVLAGPAVGMFFAELGANVTKIENILTGGDTTRHWKLPEEPANHPASAYFYSVNWHKQHRFLDLNQPDDYEQLLGLVKDADLLIANFKAGAAQKLGLDSRRLRAINPRLIYASISAYGEEDPRPGFDVAIQAETGWIHMNGEPERPPVKLPVALMDLLAAHQLKAGILAALYNREKSGEGCEVTVSLFDAGVASLANQAANWLNAGHLPQRMGSLHPNIAPYGEIFETLDGKLLILATGTARHFESLCELLEMPAMAKDARFSSNQQRLLHRPALNDALGAAFKRYTAADLLQKGLEREVPVAPVRNLQEVFELPEARSMMLEEIHPDGSFSRRVKTVVFKIKP